MTDDERAVHKQKMHEGLEAILTLMTYSKEDGGAFLLDMGLRALCVMRDDGDVGPTEALVLRARLVAAFEYAHPRVSHRLRAEMSNLNAVIAQVLYGAPADAELVQRVKAALRDFQKRGLETLQ
jgi:hypothetical protein